MRAAARELLVDASPKWSNNMPEDPTPPAPEQPEPRPSEPVRLPDDHPLVTAYNTVKGELAQKSQRLQEIDDANKTETQKQADRIAQLEQENGSLKSERLRLEVAAAKGVPANLIAGSTKEELEKAADDLLAFKGESPAPLPGNPRPAGPVSPVQEHEESREDRRKRLAESLKR
jgi:hypothetical protein